MRMGFPGMLIGLCVLVVFPALNPCLASLAEVMIVPTSTTIALALPRRSASHRLMLTLTFSLLRRGEGSMPRSVVLLDTLPHVGFRPLVARAIKRTAHLINRTMSIMMLPLIMMRYLSLLTAWTAGPPLHPPRWPTAPGFFLALGVSNQRESV